MPARAFSRASSLASTLASPQSTLWVDEGMAHLEQQQFARALQAFELATQADPADAEAWFFAGVAANRMGQPGAALRYLEMAQERGLAHPELPFERGWALLQLRRWAAAADELRRFEQAHPDRGQTQEFLGRAYLGMGNLAQAERAFEEALRRDPALEPTISVYRAALAERRGDELAARDALASLIRGAPESAAGQVIGRQLDPMVAITTDKPWRLTLEVGGGYSSDARGTQVIRPLEATDGVRREGSAFGQLAVDFDYALVRTPDTQVHAGYELQTDAFAERELDADLLDQVGYLETRQVLTHDLTGTARIWINHTAVDYDALRTQLGASADLTWTLPAGFEPNLAYSYSHNEYLYSTRPRLDRDSQAHTATVGLRWNLPRSSIHARGGFFHTWNFADGNDFDYHASGLFAGVGGALTRRLHADVLYIKSFDRYEDVNSASEFEDKRRDDAEALVLRLTQNIGRQTWVFLEYSYSRDLSNIELYEYEQHTITGGFVWRF